MVDRVERHRKGHNKHVLVASVTHDTKARVHYVTKDTTQNARPDTTVQTHQNSKYESYVQFGCYVLFVKCKIMCVDKIRQKSEPKKKIETRRKVFLVTQAAQWLL